MKLWSGRRWGVNIFDNKGTTPKKYTETGIAFIKTEAFDGSYINSKKISFIDEDTHNKELKGQF
jgi:hypothetical protein